MATLMCARSIAHFKTAVKHSNKLPCSFIMCKHVPKYQSINDQRRETSYFDHSFDRKKMNYLREMYRRRIEVGPEPERHPSAYGCWNHDAEVYAFGQRFGEQFDENILKQAFIASSYVEKQQAKDQDLGFEMDDQLEDNTELASEGRRQASQCIKAYLRCAYPDMFEEGICAIHDHLLLDETLLLIASNLGVRELIQTAEYPPKDHEYINCFLAVIGALQESQHGGQERVEKFVVDFIISQLIGKDVSELWTMVNPMGLLSSLLKCEGRGLPEPRLLWKSASSSIIPLYHVGIYSDKQLLGKSPGESLMIAEELAAREALRKMMNLSECRPPLVIGQKAHELDLNYDIENRSVSELGTS